MRSEKETMTIDILSPAGYNLSGVHEMEFKELLEKHKVSMAHLSRRFRIPYRTLENWSMTGAGHRECPPYILEMMDELLTHDEEKRPG